MECKITIAVACLILIAGRPVAANETPPEDAEVRTENSLIGAIVSGKPVLDVRYRFEFKEQDGFAENAYANTLRTRLGYETGDFYNFKLLVEFENVVALGADRFNSTTNGRVEFPVIADPDATEVNRAQITFTGIPDTAMILGRQRINLLNQRFIGAVDFRQNQQTFDAARITASPFDRITVDYFYIDRVHRVFGDDNPLGEFDSDSHVAALSADGGKFGKLTAYGLLLDLEEAPALSSATWGARYEKDLVFGQDAQFGLGGVAEFAMQRDYAENPFNYEEYYVHGELAANWRAFGVTAGYERLGGNGEIGFSTPLATLHKFQGFADVFLVTPADGIQDIYGGASYVWSPAPFGTAIRLFAVYHDFRTERDSSALGNEIDAGMTVGIGDYWSVEVKGAVFRGDSAGPADRSLLWASLRFRY